MSGQNQAQNGCENGKIGIESLQDPLCHIGNVYAVTRDITTLNGVEAITNAANSGLRAGGGVCGAIFSAAGHSELANACRSIGQCPTGSAVATPGFRLEKRGIKWIIHAVGPIGEDASMLKRTYLSILNICRDNGVRSVAVPCISTGIYGFPNSSAARVAMETVRDWMTVPANRASIDAFVFCLFMQEDIDLYTSHFDAMFGQH